VATPLADQNVLLQAYLQTNPIALTLRKLFSKPDVGGSLDATQAEMSETYQQTRDGSSTAKELTEKAALARQLLEAAKREEEQVQTIAQLRKEAAAIRETTTVRSIDQGEADRKARAEAEAAKAALLDEKKRIEEERRTTEKSIERGDRRGLPEQVRAQREAGEAQSAEGALRRSPSLANRRNYDRELAEAKAAEEQAQQTIAALTSTLARLNSQYKQVEDKLRNLPVQ
jgi:chromosome segregation ATPase